MGIARAPWLGNFTLNDTNVHRLSDILKDVTYVDTEYQPFFGGGNISKAQFLVIKNDINNGGKRLNLGNEGLSTTFYGDQLVAGQELPIYSMESNLIVLDDIYLMAVTSGLIVCVKLLTR